ncbi:MAG: EAL domain-containing protein (putative c-di-GMP-specific phosphodiesterase class I) [Oleiphilaceae bacterium]|jgi:EAL domain-containing protein (putative c-di-GMP-specific phosphodiesterase class I)
MPSSSDNKLSQQLVSGLVTMIKSLGLNIVAEGLEEMHDLEMYKSLLIKKVQSYYFSRPLNVSDIESIDINL